ncbi:MAG: barstar family protein [Clostridia bacterium]|nr:barstar family protein [Clostridia bacterium]
MRVIILDGKMMKTPEETHAYIAKEADFPPYYGKNLDALADCLSELGKNTCVVLLNDKDMRKSLGSYADRLLSVFEETSSEPYSFNFVICEE